MKDWSSDAYDVMIAGAGPAGTSAAIDLAQSGARVLLVEQNKFPRAKLCGEFISPECLVHFARLGVLDRIRIAGAREIKETIFYTRTGNSVAMPSEWLGMENSVALGLSRAAMDHCLLERARAVGVRVVEDKKVNGVIVEQGRVCGVWLNANGVTHECRARITIDATGRARMLARYTERQNIERKQALRKRASLVAFKAHLENAQVKDRACEIYFYQGGYGGLSAVEDGKSNLCFIVAARDARLYGGDAARIMRKIVASNKRAFYTLHDARVCSEWLSVALEGFGRYQPTPMSGLIAVGDAAAFIDPFTGSGMLMALESGELAAKVIAEKLSSSGAFRVSTEIENEYKAAYENQFGARLRLCSLLRRAAFAPSFVAEAALIALKSSAKMRRALALATRTPSPAQSEDKNLNARNI